MNFVSLNMSAQDGVCQGTARKGTTFSRAVKALQSSAALAAAGRALHFALIGTTCLVMTCAVDSVVPRAQAGPFHCFYVRKSELVRGKSAESNQEGSFHSGQGNFFHVTSANSYTLTPLDFNLSAENYFRAASQGAAYFQRPTNPPTTTSPLQFQNLRKEWIESHEFVCGLQMKSPSPANN
jgi:hypothetical protein